MNLTKTTLLGTIQKELIDSSWNKWKINSNISDQKPSIKKLKGEKICVSIKPYLDYFCFDGSGKKVSDHPAQGIIEFSDPCNIGTWKQFNRANYINLVWPNLVFSLRSKKGMPPNINSVNEPDRSSILQWSQTFQGSLRGALHVRFK